MARIKYLRIPRRTDFLDFLPLPCEKRVKEVINPIKLKNGEGSYVCI